MIDLQRILELVEEESGLPSGAIKNRERNSQRDLARGVFYLLAVSEGYRPKEISIFVERSRVNVQIVVQHYKGYLQTGDVRTTKLYNKVKERL